MSVIADIAAQIALLQREVRLPTAIGYGVDLVCVDDVDPNLAETDPLSVAGLGQDAYHRIITPRGQCPDAPDYGIDVVSMLHQGITAQDVAAVSGAVRLELQKDDRIASADVVFAQEGSTFRLTIQITPEDPALQAFKLIVAVADGVALLEGILA